MGLGITHCRLCRGSDLTPVLSLGNLALTGVFRKTKGSVPRHPLNLLKCDNCDLVQLEHSVDKDILFGETYGYRSGLNQSMVRHLKSIADELTPNLKKGDLVVDIGSNDGTLLKSYANPGDLELLGIDPLIPKFKEFYPSHIQTVPEFFSMWKVPRKAKVVTSIAMLYDLEDPIHFAQHVSSILERGGVWFFEVSYLPTVLEQLAYDSICHEHLTYLSLRQIIMILDAADMEIVKASLTATNGGSIAITAKHKKSTPTISNRLDMMRMCESHLSLPTTYKDFAKRVEVHKIELRKLLVGLKEEEKVVMGLGASTKGNVLLQYCDITPDLLPLIGEVNKEKIGCLTPGSEILITSEETIKNMKPDYLLVLPYHFSESIVPRETSFIKSGGKLIFPLPIKPSIVAG